MQTVSIMSCRDFPLLCCPCSQCECTSLTVCFSTFAVLSCAIFSPHHVHQQRPERERLCHCLSYVSAPVWSNGFTRVLLFVPLTLHLCVALRYDGGGAGHSCGHRNPGTDSRWRPWLSHWAWCHRQQERNQNQHVPRFTGWDGESFVMTFTTVWYSVFKWWCKLTLSFCPQKQAYLIASGVICIIYVLCATVLFLGVKEQKGMNLWRNKRSSHLSDARVET